MTDILERLRQHIGLDQLDEDDQVALVPRWEVEEAADEIGRLRAEISGRKVELDTLRIDFGNLYDEIERLRELLRQVVRSSWPPPPSWYAEAQAAALLESGEFVRSATEIPRDEDGAA